MVCSVAGCFTAVAPALPKPVPMDAVRQTAALIRYAGQVPLTDTLAWLRRSF